MKEMKNRILTLLTVAAAALGVAARPAPSLLTIRDSLDRIPVVYPESFETDARAMQQNWYLRNYADIDRQADSRPDVSVTDEEIIERLGKIPTTIELPFNSVVRNYIKMYTERRRQLVENMLGMSLYYMPIFEQALDRHGLPLELKYLPVIESALNPDAVSRAGATGLWQFMIPTAQGEGLEVNTVVDQRRDPYTSSEAAATYLKKLYDIYSDWSLAIASYNCGPGNVNKAIRRAGLSGDDRKDFWAIYPFLPSETRGYVPAFIAATYVMTYYDKHNISPALARKPILADTVHVSRRVHFEQISDVMGIPVEELRVLNPQYRRDFIPGDIRPYSLVLPSLQVYAYLANEDSIVNHNADKYLRRDVVEPSDGSVSRSDSRGEYVEEQVTKYHTVKRGENLASIAKKYGVSQSSIRQANNIRKRHGVKRGQRLRIVVTTRRYVEPKEETPPAPTENPEISENSEISETAKTAPAPKPAESSAESSRVSRAMNGSAQKADTKKAAADKPAKKPEKARTHTVRKGDNLGRLATKYGVSADAIRQANGIKGDNIQIGQKLTIPAKGTKATKGAKGKSSKKSSKRRR